MQKNTVVEVVVDKVWMKFVVEVEKGQTKFMVGKTFLFQL
jgi:hypothetical protein